MDTSKRLLIKSLSWQFLGFISMTIVGYIFTGSLNAGGGIAISGAILGFFSYFLHEKLWSKIRWGRKI